MKWVERNEIREQSFSNLFRHIRCIYVPLLLKAILSDPLVKNNLDCSNLAFDVMKMVFSGQKGFLKFWMKV